MPIVCVPHSLPWEGVQGELWKASEFGGPCVAPARGTAATSLCGPQVLSCSLLQLASGSTGRQHAWGTDWGPVHRKPFRLLNQPGACGRPYGWGRKGL